MQTYADFPLGNISVECSKTKRAKHLQSIEKKLFHKDKTNKNRNETGDSVKTISHFFMKIYYGEYRGGVRKYR